MAAGILVIKMASILL